MFALICTNSKTWIYWNCQVILLFLLLCVSFSILPVPSRPFTAFNQSSAFSFFPLHVTPLWRPHMFVGPSVLSVLLLAAMNFRDLFFSFSDATRGSAVKRFSISFARHPTNGTFAFYFKRYFPLHPFLIFSFILKCGIHSIMYLSVFHFGWHPIPTYLPNRWYCLLPFSAVISTIIEHHSWNCPMATVMMSLNSELTPGNSNFLSDQFI